MTGNYKFVYPSGFANAADNQNKPAATNGSSSPSVSGTRNNPGNFISSSHSGTQDNFHTMNSSNGSDISNTQVASNPTNNRNSTDIKKEVDDYMAGQGCKPTRPPFPANTPIAMAYIPFQQFGAIYPAEKGMEAGTIFPDLNLPFLGAAGKRGNTQ